jgi:hypothetical protein
MKKDTIQLEQNPDANERHFVRACRKYHLELLDEWKRKNPEPQQLEYIATSGDLDCIEKMLGRKSNLVQAIRSRPHTPAPVTKPVCLCPSCRMNVHQCLEKSQQHDGGSTKDHEDFIARTATLKTLDNLEAWCKVEWKSVEYLDLEPKCIIRNEITELRKHLKSLRQQAGEQQ